MPAPAAAPAGVVSGTGALAQNDVSVQGSYHVNGFNQITGFVTNYTVLNAGTPNAAIVPTSITPTKVRRNACSQISRKTTRTFTQIILFIKA